MNNLHRVGGATHKAIAGRKSRLGCCPWDYTAAAVSAKERK
jgi:hypothetical protein